MKITVTQRIEVNGQIEEQSVSAEINESCRPYGIGDDPWPSDAEIASEAAKELFKSLP
jgi:hypothetical protein